MTGAFLDGISGKLAERWASELLTPAAAFWVGGFAFWVLAEGWSESGERIAGWFGQLTGAEQVLVAGGGLLVLLATAAVFEQATIPVLRLLEGYWPRALGPIRHLLTSLISWRLRAAERRLQTLEAQRREGDLSVNEAIEFARVDERLRRSPTAPELRMPTRLGNILRAGETWPRDKYGLDTLVCWPRMWLVLPADAREELTQARRRLDAAVAWVMCGALLAVWAFLTWWALLAAAGIYAFGYWSAIRAASAFADLVEALYDVFRGSLYEALRLPVPPITAGEREAGEALTAYLWRGP